MLLAVGKWGRQGGIWTVEIKVLPVQKLWPEDRTTSLVVTKGQRSRVGLDVCLPHKVVSTEAPASASHTPGAGGTPSDKCQEKTKVQEATELRRYICSGHPC